MKPSDDLLDQAALDGAIDVACGSIAPTWPLDRFIAVNPYWHWTDRPFDVAARELAHLSGTSLYRTREDYRAAWARGEFGADDLMFAIREGGESVSLEAVVAELARARQQPPRLPLLSDLANVAALQEDPVPGRDRITLQISQFCAAWFDTDQADWHPSRASAMFGAWCDAMVGARTAERGPWGGAVCKRLTSMPREGRAAIPALLKCLDVPSDEAPALLTATLMRVGGWAAWCAFLRWEARLANGDDDTIVDLLAIRLAWEALIDDGDRSDASAWAGWRRAWRAAEPMPTSDVFLADRLAQRALEHAYQRSLIGALDRPAVPAAEASAPLVQAAFCIDVRSEVFRRALEAVTPQVRTLGFAGFFGLPIAYRPLGADAARPQLPGLLGPSLMVRETTGDVVEDARLEARRGARLADRSAEERFGRLPGSAFTLVEARGLGYVPRLLRRVLPSTRPRTAWDHEALRGDEAAALRLRLERSPRVGVGDRAAMAAAILRAMGLTRDFASLVLLVGHGSQSVNNAHEAGLDCGACGGQTGEVNARALAEVLNDFAVREALIGEGIAIPTSTWFLAALHNTTTDDVELHGTAGVPPSHGQALTQLRVWLAEAGDRARAERAPALGLGALAARPEALRRAIRSRANDWAQTRPEWGLANNAALVVGPRTLTRAVDLGGRVFLHEYDWRADPEGTVLAGILTAPMVVTHWINMQYHASTVDNARYGSGNKVLHNVVGGRIGVFEGNQGDLRIGLPLQSLHDGERWRHAPLRITTVVEAPADRIGGVIEAHEVVRRLVENEWVFLIARDAGTGRFLRRTRRGWLPF